jgi:acyl-CoA thioester hydrolase
VGRHVYTTPVRWSDTDAYGHLNNARFLTYLEDARVDLFFTLAKAEGLPGWESGVVVQKHEITYRRPVGYGELLRIELWVSHLRAAAFTVDYACSVEGGSVATASTVCVPYDLKGDHIRRISAAERDFLLGYADEGASA